MVEVTDFLLSLTRSYEDSIAIQVLVIAIILTVVSLFIWEFYKSTSKKNLIGLNLRQFNRSEHPGLSKLLATVLFLVEYVILMPLLIILWYAALALILFLIAKERPIEGILMVAAAVIATIRILAYFKGEISKDVAKLFPFIALSMFLLSPGAFDLNRTWLKIINIPQSLSLIIIYVVIIISIEIALRIVDTIFEFIKSSKHPDAPDEEDEDE
jgi:hypothetical protein